MQTRCVTNPPTPHQSHLRLTHIQDEAKLYTRLIHNPPPNPKKPLTKPRPFESKPPENLFACFVCLRLKSGKHFPLINLADKLGKEGDCWGERWCWSCGPHHGRVEPGKVVTLGDGVTREISCLGCLQSSREWCPKCKFCRSCADRQYWDGKVLETLCCSHWIEYGGWDWMRD